MSMKYNIIVLAVIVVYSSLLTCTSGKFFIQNITFLVVTQCNDVF